MYKVPINKSAGITCGSWMVYERPMDDAQEKEKGHK